MLDFAQLVEKESRGLVAAVTVIVGDHHRAEEIVQDAFERAFRRWHRVSRLDRPGAWARRVALNGAVSAVRRSGSERRAIVRLVSEAGSGAGVRRRRCPRNGRRPARRARRRGRVGRGAGAAP